MRCRGISRLRIDLAAVIVIGVHGPEAGRKMKPMTFANMREHGVRSVGSYL